MQFRTIRECSAPKCIFKHIRELLATVLFLLLLELVLEDVTMADGFAGHACNTLPNLVSGDKLEVELVKRVARHHMAQALKNSTCLTSCRYDTQII